MRKIIQTKKAQEISAALLVDENPAKIIKENITVVKQFADTIDGQLTTAFKNFFDATSEQFNDFKDLATAVATAVINELINVFIVQKAVGMVKGTIK